MKAQVIVGVSQVNYGLAISFVYVYIWSPKISDCILYILEVNRWIKTRKYSRFDSSMQSRLLKKHLWEDHCLTATVINR